MISLRTHVVVCAVALAAAVLLAIASATATASQPAGSGTLPAHGGATPASAPGRANGAPASSDGGSSTATSASVSSADPSAIAGAQASHGPANVCDGDPSGHSDSGHGANYDGPYESVCPSGPSLNGNGTGNATGRPCAGCVGNADDKQPKGQLPSGDDQNAGYECDRNDGIGRSNPAHTRPCVVSTTPTCPTGSELDASGHCTTRTETAVTTAETETVPVATTTTAPNPGTPGTPATPATPTTTTTPAPTTTPTTPITTTPPMTTTTTPSTTGGAPPSSPPTRTRRPRHPGVFKPPAVPPAQPGTPVVTNGALPFTGLQLSLVVVIGFELLAIGTLVRRIGALLR